MSHGNREIRRLVCLVHAGSAAVVALAAAAVVLLVVLPSGQKADQTESKARDYQRELDLLTEVRSSMDEINKEMGRYRDDLNRFEAQLPSSTKMDDFLKGFSALASRCRVQIDEIRPRQLTAGPIYWQLPILVRARAGFMDYFEFLAKLQNYARITRIQRLDVAAAPGEKLCTFEMTVLIYATGPGRSVADAGT
jgi:Tfp pilus assembly protein PilO